MRKEITRAHGWQEKPLDQLARLVGGGTPPRSHPEYFGTDIDWVTPSDLPAIGQVELLGPVSEGLSKRGLANSSAKEIVTGSVLYSSRASIGKIAVTNRVCATNQGFTNFIPKAGAVDPWFLAYLLCHHTPAITRLAGETTYKEVSRRKLGKFKVDVPRFQEQKRIAARIKRCLGCVQEIQMLRRKSLEEAAILGGAVFSDCLEDMISGTGVPIVPISDVAKVNPKRDIGIRTLDGDLEVSFVPMAAVDKETGTITNALVRPLADVRKGFTCFLKGDVIFAKITPCMQNGKSAVAHSLVNGLGFGSTEFHVLRPGPDVLAEWLWHIVRQRKFREEAQRNFRGSAGQQRVPASFIENYEIPLPALEQQLCVVNHMRECLKRVNGICNLLEHKSDSNVGSRTDPRKIGFDGRQLTNAILRKAFSGEL